MKTGDFQFDTYPTG